jgi:membrane-bound lytic murein transglycosylase B
MRPKLTESLVDYKIGICLGLGLTIEQSAEHIGIAQNTLREHRERFSTLIETIRAETEAVAAKKYAKKVRELEENVADRLSVADAKREVRDQVWNQLLRKLKTELPDDVFAKLSRTALEFSDEKPAQVQKRISEHTETIEHRIADETWDRLEKHYRETGVLPPILAALPPVEATDAIVVTE